MARADVSWLMNTCLYTEPGTRGRHTHANDWPGLAYISPKGAPGETPEVRTEQSTGENGGFAREAYVLPNMEADIKRRNEWAPEWSTLDMRQVPMSERARNRPRGHRPCGAWGDCPARQRLNGALMMPASAGDAAVARERGSFRARNARRRRTMRRTGFTRSGALYDRSSGAYRVRTDDLPLAKRMLSQLS